MDDATARIEDAKQLVREFCEARDWDRFHNPKDLAVGISTEAAELLERFRFKTPEQCSEILRDPELSQGIREELADVFYFVLRFAQMNSIDLYSALEDKIAKNGEKYPVEKSKGNYRKYDELS